MALASRTEQPAWARELVGLLGLTDRFAFAEIYPASKLSHFKALRKLSGIEFKEMLFFDDEMRNIREVSQLGVSAVHVSDGLHADLFQESLDSYLRARENGRN